MRIIREQLSVGIEAINDQANIDAQRKAFINFSATMVELMKRFKINKQAIYEMYCPMADNNTGAHWLSASPVVRNPYYGDLMLRCGEVKSTIQ